MNLFELSEYTRIKSLNSKLSPDEEYFWRLMCRQFSITFNTSIIEVEKMDPEKVFLHLQEHSLDKKDLDKEDELNEIIEDINLITDPDYENNKSKEEEEFDKMILQKEEERQKKKALQKNTSVKEEVKSEEPILPPLTLPKSGGINLSYLSENAELEG